MNRKTRIRSSEVNPFIKEGLELTMEMDGEKVIFTIHDPKKDESIAIKIDSIIRMLHLGIKETSCSFPEKKFWQRERSLFVSGLPTYSEEAEFFLAIKRGHHYQATIQVHRNEFIKKLFSIWPQEMLTRLHEKLNLDNDTTEQEINSESLFNEFMLYQRILEDNALRTH